MSLLKNRLIQILSASFLLAACFLSTRIYLINSFLHELINVFAGGRSSVKVTLFLVYASALLVINLVPKKSFKKINISYRFLIAWLIGIFSYNFFLQLFFSQKFGFSLNDFVITVNHGEISSTKLLHSHIAKGSMGWVLNLFGAANQENIDAGLAFIGLMPTVLFIIALLLLIGTVVIFLWYYWQNFSGLKKRQVALTLLYAVISFSLLKNFIDGGLLNRETLPALAALLLIILPWTKRSFALIPLGIYGLIQTWAVLGLLPIIEVRDNVLYALIFISTITTLWYWWEQKTNGRLGILLLIMTGLFYFIPIQRMFTGYNHASSSLINTPSYLGSYDSLPEFNSPVESIGDLHIYAIDTDSTRMQLYEKYHLLNNFQPITSKNRFCGFPSSLHQYKFDLVTPQPVELRPTHYQFGNITKLESFGKENSSHYHATILMNPCAPRIMNVIEELLNEQVPQPYFIINLKAETNEFN